MVFLLDELVPGLFTIPTFTQFIIPKLKQIFTVHDMQIRMILLEHFHKFMSLFAENELKGGILPQVSLFLSRKFFFSKRYLDELTECHLKPSNGMRLY